MNILTIYTKDASKLLSVLDDIVLRINITVLAADPARLYNDTNHEDVNMASITFKTDSDYRIIDAVINSNDVFLCEEDPNDWM